MTLLAANNGTLRKLRVHDCFFYADTAFITAVLAAAPLLRVLEADVRCAPADAGHLLRNERLRVREMDVHLKEEDEEDEEFTHADVMNVRALGETLAACSHPSLTSIKLQFAAVGDFEAADAIADAALALRLSSVTFESCWLCDESAHALARMLRGGSLTELFLFGGSTLLEWDDAAAQLLADALRASTTIASLCLFEVGVFHKPAVIHALVAHPTR